MKICIRSPNARFVHLEKLPLEVGSSLLVVIDFQNFFSNMFLYEFSWASFLDDFAPINH